MQTAAQDDITLPLHNWEALHQLEREKDYLSSVAGEIDVASITSGASLSSPEFLLLASRYKPLNLTTKLMRIIKVVNVLMEEFSSQGIQIFPCVEVPGYNPIDLYVRFKGLTHLLISIRSMGKSEIIYKEANETLFVRRKGKGIKKWHPDPLVELSEYQAWLIKNRQQFGMPSREVRKPLAKVLLISGETTIDKHPEHLYAKISGEPYLALNRKGTAFVIKEEQISNFIKAYLAMYQAQEA